MYGCPAQEKHCSSREFYQAAVNIREITRKYQVPLIINDRVDIALAIDADGVHVGQSDLPASVVRSIIGEDKIVGVSAAKVSEAEQAVKDGADYLGSRGDVSDGYQDRCAPRYDGRTEGDPQCRRRTDQVVIGGLIRKQCIILRIPESTAWRSYPLLLQQRTSNRRQERWYQNSGSRE